MRIKTSLSGEGKRTVPTRCELQSPENRVENDPLTPIGLTWTNTKWRANDGCGRFTECRSNASARLASRDFRLRRANNDRSLPPRKQENGASRAGSDDRQIETASRVDNRPHRMMHPGMGAVGGLLCTRLAGGVRVPNRIFGLTFKSGIEIDTD